MKITPHPEIRVAILGYVSAGKSTLLNALLRDKYSEVSMRRTTAGINLFRITTKSEDGKGLEDWSPEEVRSPESTLGEITSDNKVLRDKNLLQEKLFDLELDEPLVEMRKGTKLVLVDIPGINEAGASTKYKDYVASNWHRFDSVIIVMDGRQGMNTEEQVDLLKLAKDKCDKERKLSVIVVLNKVDDPYDDEQQILIQESIKAVKTIFGNVIDNISALSRDTGRPGGSSSHLSVVVPMSAIHAFVYRAASKLDLFNFQKKIDDKLIDKIGREVHGWKWNDFSKNDRAKKVYDIIQDQSCYERGIKESKFDDFLDALAFCVGGTKTQERLLEKQVILSLKLLSPEGNFTSELRILFDRCRLIGSPVDGVPAIFQQFHKESVDLAFSKFKGPDDVSHLALPMDAIQSYVSLSKHMGIFETEKGHIIKMAKHIVFRQIEVVLFDKEWGSSANKIFDRILVLGSMMVMSHSRFYCEHLGISRIMLEQQFHLASSKKGNKFVDQELCIDFKHHAADGAFVPLFPESYKKYASVVVPDLPSDPSHLGHLIWRFCNLMETIERDTRA